MSENIWLFTLGMTASATGALTLLLLGIIIRELRQLRDALKEFVTDKMCRIMMTEHEKDIREIRQFLANRPIPAVGGKHEIFSGDKRCKSKKRY
jgi:hypothetical protein